MRIRESDKTMASEQRNKRFIPTVSNDVLNRANGKESNPQISANFYFWEWVDID